MSRSIPLTRGKYALVDDHDYARLRQWRWYATSNGYAARKARIHGQSKTLLMHRFLLNAQQGQSVDHIDGDPLNNTRANLRLVTPRQNQHNRKAKSRSKAGYKGVTEAKIREVAISCGGVLILWLRNT